MYLLKHDNNLGKLHLNLQLCVEAKWFQFQLPLQQNRRRVPEGDKPDLSLVQNTRLETVLLINCEGKLVIVWTVNISSLATCPPSATAARQKVLQPL